MPERPVDDKRRRRRLAFGATTVLAMLAGCGGTARAADPAPPPVPPSAPVTLASVVALARADASRLSGRPLDEVAVDSASAVTWPDGSLGCPSPGRLYTQALVPGYRVVLEADGVRYDYRASRRGVPSLCPDGQAQEPLPDASR